MRLEGKTAIITGGAKGLGMEMAKRFAKEGAKVIAADMSELTYSDENVEFFKINVTDRENCKELFDYAIEKYGSVDILVNNAGITKDALTFKMTDDMWDAVINVNLTGIFNLTRLVGPHMQRSGKGEA